MENKEQYKFIGKIALEFRISLDNICKLLGKEPNETNKMQVYEFIKLSAGSDKYLIEKYNYLFFYETLNEPQNISKLSYLKTLNYIKKYMKLKKENKVDEAKQLLAELKKNDEAFSNLKNREYKSDLTEEEVIIISKYRIKHVLPRTTCCEYFDMETKPLISREKKLQDESLKYKLNLLSDYYNRYDAKRNVVK